MTVETASEPLPAPDGPSAQLDPGPRRADRRFALVVAGMVMAITLIPYVVGYSLAGMRPALGVFSWYTFNVTDHCVYLSWMRQAADGHLFQRNLFTTAPQGGHQFNLFFLLLGTIARFAHLPLIFVYQSARLILGVALLRAVWWLIELLLAERLARRTAYLLVCFSSGLGWLPGVWRDTNYVMTTPIDVWQPEAITFLSLYLFPLFLVSLLLMVGVIGWLLVAERQKSPRPAIYAGLCGLLLGNIHTYDVITLTAIWGAFLIARSALQRKLDAAAWMRAVVAGIPTAVSTGYVAYLLKTEQVFAKRAAVPTLSPPFSLNLLGYGLVLLLALAAVVLGVQAFRRSGVQALGQSHEYGEAIYTSSSAFLLLVAWAVMNMVVAYLPVPYQRKMLMGEHLPLAILAGVALAWGLQRVGERRTLVLAAALTLLALTNVRFMRRDIAALPTNGGPWVRTYMYAGEVAALDWIREHAPAGVAIQPLPWIARNEQGRVSFFDNTVACFAPGLTGHPVDAGHWGETPDFAKTMYRWAAFLRSDIPDDYRKALLRTSGVRYLLFTQKHDETHDDVVENNLLSLFRTHALPYLRLIPEASNADADVYEVEEAP